MTSFLVALDISYALRISLNVIPPTRNTITRPFFLRSSIEVPFEVGITAAAAVFDGLASGFLFCQVGFVDLESTLYNTVKT